MARAVDGYASFLFKAGKLPLQLTVLGMRSIVAHEAHTVNLMSFSLTVLRFVVRIRSFAD